MPLWKVIISEPLTAIKAQWYAVTYVVDAPTDKRATALAIEAHNEDFHTHAKPGEEDDFTTWRAPHAGIFHTVTGEVIGPVVVCGPAIPVSEPPDEEDEDTEDEDEDTEDEEDEDAEDDDDESDEGDGDDGEAGTDRA